MRLRYHHLLCLPRFRGEGYSEDFCRNMQEIKSRFRTEKHEFTAGCDDVCACCPNNIGGSCRDERKVRRYDLAVKNALEQGITPLPQSICPDCKWYYICKDIAADDM